MGKGVFTNISGAIGIPGDRRYRRSLRQRLMTSVTVMPLSTADETDHAGPRRLRRAGKARGGPTGAALGGIVGVALSTLLAGAAYANPNGGTVTAGAATIREATPKSLEVVQSSDKAVINWKSFSVGADEAVRFRQPSKDSVTLNRVTGNDPSAILGSVSANGTVMLVNPNGVVFGAGAKVDVGGLVATTANISDADFMAGRYVFDQASGKPDAVVANEGDINIRDSGLAALVAPHVRNSGVIRAKLGKVALGGAQTFTLDFHGDGLISFDAGSAVATAAKDADGNPVKALVVNTGEVSAEGGTVTLSARAVKGVIDNVINTTGIVKATSVSGSNGRIVLSGGDVGTVAIGGVVDAGGGAGQTGGTVVATGAEIAIAGKTVIDASGHQGGGTVSIGSAPGRDGKWSEKVSVGTGAILSADAVKAGKGGAVTVLSDKKTRHAGRISARGGEQGGDGGFAEVSSRKDIVLTGEVDLSAPKGMSGVFLLDPETLRIVGPSGGSQNTAAGDGVVSVGDVDLGSDSNINTISRSVLEGIAGTASIVLEASGQITVETGLDLQTAAGRSFTLRSLGAGGGISFTDNANQISTNGGDINLEAQGVGATLGNIGKLATKGGAVQLSANGSIQVANQIDTTPTTGTAGAITVRSMTGSIAATTPAKLTGGSVTLSAVNGGIGASGAPVATSTRQLTLETGAGLHVGNDQALTHLTLDARRTRTGGAETWQLSSTGLTFDTAASSGLLSVNTISQTGGLTALGVTGDRAVQVGTVNAGTGSVSLTAAGGDLTGATGNLVTGGSVTLTAKGTTGLDGGIGTGASSIATAASSLTAVSGSKGFFLANTGAVTLASLAGTASGSSVTASGDITVGAVSLAPASGSGSLTLTSSGGGILDDADAATTIRATALTLGAAGAIGSAGTALTTTAATVTASSGTGGVDLSTAGAATFCP